MDKLMSILTAIGTFIERLSGFFQEHNQDFSMSRLMSAYITYQVIATWAHVCVSKGEILPIDISLLGALGIAGGIKVGQKALESAKDAPKEENCNGAS